MLARVHCGRVVWAVLARVLAGSYASLSVFNVHQTSTEHERVFNCLKRAARLKIERMGASYSKQRPGCGEEVVVDWSGL